MSLGLCNLFSVNRVKTEFISWLFGYGLSYIFLVLTASLLVVDGLKLR